VPIVLEYKNLSFGSSNGNEATPLHNYAFVSNGDGYDNDDSNFALP